MFISGIAERYQDSRLFVLAKTEKMLATPGIEIAHPTRADSLLRCRQTKMLDGNGYVDITMMLAI